MLSPLRSAARVTLDAARRWTIARADRVHASAAVRRASRACTTSGDRDRAVLGGSAHSVALRLRRCRQSRSSVISLQHGHCPPAECLDQLCRGTDRKIASPLRVRGRSSRVCMARRGWRCTDFVAGDAPVCLGTSLHQPDCGAVRAVGRGAKPLTCIRCAATTAEVSGPVEDVISGSRPAGRRHPEARAVDGCGW